MIWLAVSIVVGYIAGIPLAMVYLKWCADQTLFTRPTLGELFRDSVLWPLELARAFFGFASRKP